MNIKSFILILLTILTLSKTTVFAEGANFKKINMNTSNKDMEVALNWVESKVSIELYIEFNKALKYRSTSSEYGRALGSIETIDPRYIVSANVKVKNIRNNKISFKLSEVLLISAEESYKPFAYSDDDIPVKTKRDIIFNLQPGESKTYSFHYSINQEYSNLDFKFKNLSPIQVKEIPNPRSIKPRLDELKAESAEVRQEAVKALGVIKNPGAVQPLISALNDENQKNTEISFYHVKNKISYDDFLKNNLSGVVLDKSPIFTTKDIIEYSQNEHTIKLTKEAFKKYYALRDNDYFAICVDNQPAYLGMVWHEPTYWSAQPTGFWATAVTTDGRNEIQLEYDNKYNDGTKKEGYDDPRQNKLILDSLKRSNKLIETITEQKALEIAKKFFPELNYGPIEQYKFTSKNGFESWSIFYISTGKYNWITNRGAIIVDKKTGETKHVPGMKP